MLGGNEGVVNFDDARRAVLGRLLPGATLLAIGSPWAPRGPAFERFSERHGKPGPEHVVVRARADAMNPVWWTAERVERMRTSNPLVFATDVRGEFADPVQAFLSQTEVRAAVRKEPLVLPPRTGRTYLFSMDPATRRNAWTLIGLAFYIDDEGVTRYEVVLARQWQGTPTAPLSPHAIHKEIAKIIRPYGGVSAFSDQHAGDHNREIAGRAGYKLIIRTVVAGNSPEPSTGQPAPEGKRYRADMYETLRGAFATGVISIPNEASLVRDLLSVRKRVTLRGLDYELPETSDGRHADYAPALALALIECPNVDDIRRYAAQAAALRQITGVLDRGEGYDDRDIQAIALQQILEAGRRQHTDIEYNISEMRLHNEYLRRIGSSSAVSDEVLERQVAAFRKRMGQ
jgi:hypothetical protein